MRILKGIAWWLVFSALCAAATLAAMRQIAERSGRAGLYAAWMDEIRDAFAEADGFVDGLYEKARETLRYRAGRTEPGMRGEERESARAHAGPGRTGCTDRTDVVREVEDEKDRVCGDGDGGGVRRGVRGREPRPGEQGLGRCGQGVRRRLQVAGRGGRHGAATAPRRPPVAHAAGARSVARGDGEDNAC